MKIVYADIIAPLTKTLKEAEESLEGLALFLLEAELDGDFELEEDIRQNIEYHKQVKETTEVAIFMVN